LGKCISSILSACVSLSTTFFSHSNDLSTVKKYTGRPPAPFRHSWRGTFEAEKDRMKQFVQTTGDPAAHYDIPKSLVSIDFVIISPFSHQPSLRYIVEMATGVFSPVTMILMHVRHTPILRRKRWTPSHGRLPSNVHTYSRGQQTQHPKLLIGMLRSDFPFLIHFCGY
jgi:hypothetical protein